MPDPVLPAPGLGCLAAPPVPDAPLLGVLVLLPVLPLVAPPDAAPEPDFLKCASHSSREICPSPFLSTDEKLGVCAVAPLDAPAFGALEAPPDALLPEDAPAALSEGLLSVALWLCAAATLASAKSAAAVAVPTTLNNMG
jgi:hypothetical protein